MKDDKMIYTKIKKAEKLVDDPFPIDSMS